MAESIDDIKKETQELEKQLKLIAEYQEAAGEIDIERVAANKERIKQLEKQLEIYKSNAGYDKEEAKAIEESIKNLKQKLSLYKEQGTAIGYMLRNIQSLGPSMNEFIQNTSAQYVLAEQIAKTYKRLGRDIGMTGANAEDMNRNFKKALPSMIEMGLNGDELATIFRDISESTGRVSTLTDKDAEKIGSIAASMNLSVSEAAKMSESFILMGLSTDKIEENILETYKSAQGMGLNATKVIKVLQLNMNQMQSFSFKSGVKGMSEMAKQAVKMRLDVSDVLQMADKFYQPEAAIEAAANLQMLGGDIAKAFGDPLEMMYLARNSPDELFEKLQSMTENMMQFNETSGEYEFPAEVRMQLKAAGEQLGINTEKMVEMARQTSKIKDIKMKFNMTGLDDDMKENLASLATFSKDKNEFVIKHDGDELGLDEINESMAEEIMKSNQTEAMDLKDIAVNTQVMSEQLKNFNEARKAEIAGLGNIYELTADEIAPQLQKMKEGVGNLVDVYIENAEKFLKEEFSGTDKSSFDNAFKEISDLASHIKDGLIPTFGELKKTIDVVNAKINNTGPPLVVEDMASLPGSNGRVLTGGFGALSLDNRDLVVAGDPNKLLGGSSSGVSSKMEFGNLNISGRIEIISPDGSSNNMDMASLKPQIEKMIINHMNGTFRDGGISSSKQATDYMG